MSGHGEGGVSMDGKPKDWVDFAAAKAVQFEVVLAALGLLGSLRRDGEQLQGICPLHKPSGEKKESFGVHVGKQTFNCFACKKHGKVVDFVMQVKGIGAKEAAGWLLSLVDNQGEVQQVAAGVLPAGTEVQESVHVEASGNGVGVAAVALGVEASPAVAGERRQLTEREAWLLGLMAHATALAFAQLFEPLRDTKTVEQTIMAMVEIHGGVYEAVNRENG